MFARRARLGVAGLISLCGGGADALITTKEEAKGSLVPAVGALTENGPGPRENAKLTLDRYRESPAKTATGPNVVTKRR